MALAPLTFSKSTRWGPNRGADPRNPQPGQRRGNRSRDPAPVTPTPPYFVRDDRKRPLEDFNAGLATLTFQEQLGSMLAKVYRLEKLAPSWPICWV